LTNSLDFGLSEFDFWEMTPGEVVRYAESRTRVRKLEAQEKATYDYILANLIVKGVGLTLGSKGSFPSIEEAYPTLFQEEVKEVEERNKEQRMSLSALRFKQFAQSYNKKFKDKEVL
jgi:hypothetical protein